MWINLRSRDPAILGWRDYVASVCIFEGVGLRWVALKQKGRGTDMAVVIALLLCAAIGLFAYGFIEPPKSALKLLLLFVGSAILFALAFFLAFFDVSAIY